MEREGTSGADKLYYLKKCVTGPADACLEGSFNNDEAYRDAWEKLNQRYG